MFSRGEEGAGALTGSQELLSAVVMFQTEQLREIVACLKSGNEGRFCIRSLPPVVVGVSFIKCVVYRLWSLST